MWSELVLLGCVAAGTFCMLRRLRHCGRRDWLTQRTCMRLVWWECEEVVVEVVGPVDDVHHRMMWHLHLWTTDEAWVRMGLNDAGR